jgi:uncharacterized protein involved in exopolysaccharide biosynthesis
MSDEEKTGNMREMVTNYLALARKAVRFWPRAFAAFAIILVAGMVWVVKKPRVFKSEASATIHDASAEGQQSLNPEEALADLRARLDQVYGSRANLGRVVDELHLFPWLRGKTSHLKIIEAFQESMTYTASGRDAFHLEFLYQDPHVAQRVVQRLLQLYTDERRAAGQAQTRNDLTSVETALSGLENVLGDQEERLARFERANHDMVEQVRMRRLGQMQARLGPVDPMVLAAANVPPPAGEPSDSVRTRRLRIRAAALSARMAAVQRAIATPGVPAAAPTPSTPAEESERVQTMRRNVSELRERLSRLRTTYTDEYPDVQITVRRLADAERELQSTLAAERTGHARASVANVNVDSPEALRAQLTGIQREIEETRAALVASIREDRARAPVATAAPAPAAQRGTPNAAHGGGPAHARSAVPPAPRAQDEAGDGERLGSLVEVESMWDRLTGEATTTRTRYQQLLTRKFELQAALDTMSATGADVLRVIDPPSLAAEPEPPGRTRLALIVFALALVLSLGIAGLSGYLDARIYQPADLRRWGELPELPAIPDLHAFRVSEVTPRRAATERSRA